MADSKYQKLARQLTIMRQDINEYVESVKASCLECNLYQLFFCEGEYTSSEKSPYYSKSIIETYCKGLAKLASNLDLREIFQKQLIFIPKFYRINSLVKNTINTKLGCFIEKRVSVWKVRMISLHPTSKDLKNLFSDTFLYCASPSEYPDCPQWFDINKISTFTPTFIRIQTEYVKQNKLIENLKKLAPEYFTEYLKKYLEVFYKSGDFLNKEFAPQSNENILEAYKKNLILIKSRKFKHYFEFLNKWKGELVRIMFEDVEIDVAKRSTFLSYLDQFLLENTLSIVPLKKSRWENSQAIDQFTASAIIYYFVDLFIKDPSKKVLGQLVCLLWTLVWFAHETQDNPPTLNEIINMTTKNIVTNERRVIISGVDITVSQGLMDFYLILRGKGKGTNSCRLFPNLTLKNVRSYLESLPSFFKHSGEILPQAFLYFPHPNQNQRISPSMLEVMRNTDNDAAMKMRIHSIVYQVGKNEKCS
jgi:hypothetical protein